MYKPFLSTFLRFLLLNICLLSASNVRPMSCVAIYQKCVAAGCLVTEYSVFKHS